MYNGIMITNVYTMIVYCVEFNGDYTIMMPYYLIHDFSLLMKTCLRAKNICCGYSYQRGNSNVYSTQMFDEKMGNEP